MSISQVLIVLIHKTVFHCRRSINWWTLPQSCSNEFLGCIPRLPPNSHARARLGENCIHHPPRCILLQGYAIQLKKCWGHILEDDHLSWVKSWMHTSTIWWSRVKKNQTHQGFDRSVHNIKKTHIKIEHGKMCLRG